MKTSDWLLAVALTMFVGSATGATKAPSVDVTGTWGRATGSVSPERWEVGELR